MPVSVCERRGVHRRIVLQLLYNHRATEGLARKGWWEVRELPMIHACSLGIEVLGHGDCDSRCGGCHLVKLDVAIERIDD